MGSYGFWSKGLNVKTNCSNDNTLVNYKPVCSMNFCTWYSLSKPLLLSECICCTWSLKLMILIGFIRSVTVEEKKRNDTTLEKPLPLLYHNLKFRKTFSEWLNKALKCSYRNISIHSWKITQGFLCLLLHKIKSSALWKKQSNSSKPFHWCCKHTYGNGMASLLEFYHWLSVNKRCMILYVETCVITYGARQVYIC